MKSKLNDSAFWDVILIGVDLVNAQIRFLKNLGFVIKVHWTVFKELQNFFFKNIEEKELFSNWIEITRQTVQFWKISFQFLYEQIHDNMTLGKIVGFLKEFKNIKDHLSSYKQFCVRIQQLTLYFEHLCHHNEDFRKFQEVRV